MNHVKAKNGGGGDGGKSLTVSVKSTKSVSAQKRKGDTVAEVYAEEIGEKEAKRMKKGLRRSR